MSDQEKKENQDSWSSILSALMPFLTSKNFMVLLAGLGGLLGGSFMHPDSLRCILDESQSGCDTASATKALTITQVLNSNLREAYGLYPIKKPSEDAEMTVEKLQSSHRDLASAIRSLCSEEELQQNPDKCYKRETLLQELREMSGLSGRPNAIFEPVPQSVYVSAYSVPEGTANRDNINIYTAHVCDRGRDGEPGEYRFRLFRLYSDRQPNGSSPIRGMPTLNCSDPGYSEFNNMPTSETEIIRVHPDIYKELFGSAAGSLAEARLKIQIEPVGEL